jgi:hypothetical protein
MADRVTAMREVIATGVHNPRDGFTTAYMHRPAELAAELASGHRR